MEMEREGGDREDGERGRFNAFYSEQVIY